MPFERDCAIYFYFFNCAILKVSLPENASTWPHLRELLRNRKRMKGYLDKRKDLRRKTRKTEWLQWLRGLTFSIVHWQSADHPPQKSRFKTIFNTLIFGQCCWRVLVKESFSRYCLGIGLAFLVTMLSFCLGQNWK